MSQPALKVYAIAELGKCPRCLKPIDLPAETAGGPLSSAICPHCEAVVGVREIRFEERPEPSEEEEDEQL